jgi:hypothetical protein
VTVIALAPRHPLTVLVAPVVVPAPLVTPAVDRQAEALALAAEIMAAGAAAFSAHVLAAHG